MYLSILGCVGALASAIKCTLAARRVTENHLIWLIVAVLNFLSGGPIICSLAGLDIKPTILDSPYKILLAFAVIIMTTATSFCGEKNLSANYDSSAKMTKLLEKLLIAADSIGVLASAAMGYEYGMQVNGLPFVAVARGWVATASSGILSMIVISTQVGKTLANKFKWIKAEFVHSVPYYAFGLTTTMVYGVSAMTVGKELAIIGLTPLVVLMGIFIHKRIDG